MYSFRLTIETVELGSEQLTTTKCAISMSCTGYMGSNRFTPTSAFRPDLLNGLGTKVLDYEIFLRRKHLQSTNRCHFGKFIMGFNDVLKKHIIL